MTFTPLAHNTSLSRTLTFKIPFLFFPSDTHCHSKWFLPFCQHLPTMDIDFEIS